jgi:hypothetical protein
MAPQLSAPQSAPSLSVIVISFSERVSGALSGITRRPAAARRARFSSFAPFVWMTSDMTPFGGSSVDAAG